MLHIIKPTGFDLDDKKLRRAGLDYGEWQDMRTYENWDDFISQTAPKRLFAISTKGARHYHDIEFANDDYVVFGPETRGLPDNVLYHTLMTEQVRIPMTENSRSMNLSNSVAVIVYESWRQQGFIHST
ncbi:tRNA (cytosine34-2'-O-)-methyltransferase [gamma proteobacterium IMCC1989]|nr:tRNA (cytosine34-2'-O-)-methyltransferase [gamma proteobacterium IMCC1989]